LSQIISQEINTVRRGESCVCVTVVRLDSAVDTVKLPDMSADSNCAVQLRRPGQNDPLLTVTQDDVDDVSLDGGRAGNEVLIVSLHNDPVKER
jgi:hypothetical protein